MDIAILGGGVAGLATALALARRGHEPRVYERRPAPATMGAGVTLWPNAGFVLADLELLDEVLALGGTPAAMHRYDAQGRSLGGLDIEPLDRLMGYPTCAILRTDLQAVLLRRAREAGVPVAFGREATAIANDPDGRAVVHFADGGRLSPDLVIGADGRMSSVARAHVAGGNAPVYQGFVNWIGVAESSRDLVDGAAIHDYWGHGERVGIVALGRRKVYWAGAQAQTLEQARASAAAAQDGEWRKVRRLFELARSHRRGHRCHAAAGPAPDRGARPGAAGPLASRQCAAGGRRRARALAHVGAGRLPGAGGCLASGALPGGSGHGAGRGTGAGAGTVRRIAAGEDGGHHTAGAVLRARVVHHGPAGLPRARRTRARQRSAARRACVGARLGAGPAFAGAGAGRSRGGHRCRQRRGTVAVTSATSWLGGRGE